MPRLVVRRSALGFAALLATYGVGGYIAHAIAVALGAVEQTNIGAGWFVTLFACGYLGLAAIHELGHVIGYRACGLHWERVTIGPLVSVRSSSPRTYRSQLLISAAGPCAQILAAAALLGAADSPWTLVGLLGLVGLVDGVLALAIPTNATTDAAKIYRSAWAIARGQGARSA